MMIITKALEKKLLANGKKRTDCIPVLKLFDPCGAATWLISEMDPGHPDTLYGLCDLGMGFPELGYMSLAEFKSIRTSFGLPLERDRHWTGTKLLSEYAEEARSHGRIKA